MRAREGLLFDISAAPAERGQRDEDGDLRLLDLTVVRGVRPQQTPLAVARVAASRQQLKVDRTRERRIRGWASVGSEHAQGVGGGGYDRCCRSGHGNSTPVRVQSGPFEDANDPAHVRV